MLTRNLKAKFWKAELSSIFSWSHLKDSDDFMLRCLLWSVLLSQMMIALLPLIEAPWTEMHLNCKALKCCGNGNNGSTIDGQSLVPAHIRLPLPSSEREMFALIKRCLSQRKRFFVLSAVLATAILGTVWVSLGQTSVEVFGFVMHQDPGDWLCERHLYRLLYSGSFLGGWQSGCKFPRVQTSVWLRSGH